MSQAKSQAIVFDVDGTAIDSPDSQEPAQRLIDSLTAAEKTYYLCAATGRPWSSTRHILETLRVTDPCIVSAGTQIRQASNGEVLWQCNIEPESLAAVVEVAKRYSQYKVLYNDFTQETYFDSASMSLEKVLEIPIHELGIIFVPAAEAQTVIESFAHIPGIACTLALAQKPGFNDILITHQNATKEHAIAQLLKILGVNVKDTIGIGDGHNDIHLFKAVSQKIAMGNAVQELKDVADVVIESVKDDGMAKYLESLVL